MSSGKEDPIYKAELQQIVGCAMEVHNSLGHGFQENPTNSPLWLNLGYKREFYYAGRDRTAGQLNANGLMLHAEAGITASLPASFLSQNNLYGLNLTYNYNFSMSETQGDLLGRSISVLPSYGWVSFGFVVQMDL